MLWVNLNRPKKAQAHFWVSAQSFFTLGPSPLRPLFAITSTWPIALNYLGLVTKVTQQEKQPQ